MVQRTHLGVSLKAVVNIFSMAPLQVCRFTLSGHLNGQAMMTSLLHMRMESQ